MLKMINKLDETNDGSLYSGKATTSNAEMYLRAAPTVDKDGNSIKLSQRYYRFRLLGFKSEDRNYPFIVRNEHEYFRKDASGKILEVKRVCCPSTLWAKGKINETVGKDYCPICKYSFDQNTEAWKSFKSTHTIDAVCSKMSKETKRRWAVYLPVLVVADPVYERNNNHLKILRIGGVEGEASGKEAKETFERILAIIAEANEKNINVFNGDEGANIAILCEKQKKYSVKKDGTPIIDPRTGEQKYYEANAVTDVRLLSKNLHSYPNITEEEIEKLNFDDTYGKAATKDVLSVFLNENYLNTGASDEIVDDDDDEFTAPISESAPQKKQTIVEDETDDVTAENEVTAVSSDDSDDSEFSASDIEDDGVESPSDAINRITKGKVKIVNSVELPKNTEELREKSTSFSDDDLPF